MAKRTRNQYSDEFRASAVLLLESEGYPDERGAITRVSDHLHVPRSTLKGWFNKANNPEPAQIRQIKKAEIVDLLRAEIYAALDEMKNSREFASYKDLATSFGIFIDKLQLLSGEPTQRIKHDDWRDEAIEYIKAGELTYQSLAEEFDHDLARDLFRSAGVPIEGTPSKAEIDN